MDMARVTEAVSQARALSACLAFFNSKILISEGGSQQSRESTPRMNLVCVCVLLILARKTIWTGNAGKVRRKIR